MDVLFEFGTGSVTRTISSSIILLYTAVQFKVLSAKDITFLPHRLVRQPWRLITGLLFLAESPSEVLSTVLHTSAIGWHERNYYIHRKSTFIHLALNSLVCMLAASLMDLHRPGLLLLYAYDYMAIRRRPGGIDRFLLPEASLLLSIVYARMTGRQRSYIIITLVSAAIGQLNVIVDDILPYWTGNPLNRSQNFEPVAMPQEQSGAPAGEAADPPADDAANQTADDAANQLVGEIADQLASEAADEPAYVEADEPAYVEADEPAYEDADEPAAAEPADELASELADEPAPEVSAAAAAAAAALRRQMASDTRE